MIYCSSVSKGCLTPDSAWIGNSLLPRDCAFTSSALPQVEATYAAVSTHTTASAQRSDFSHTWCYQLEQ